MSIKANELYEITKNVFEKYIPHCSMYLYSNPSRTEWQDWYMVVFLSRSSTSLCNEDENYAVNVELELLVGELYSTSCSFTFLPNKIFMLLLVMLLSRM
jgi:hypothetical protein